MHKCLWWTEVEWDQLFLFLSIFKLEFKNADTNQFLKGIYCIHWVKDTFECIYIGLSLVHEKAGTDAQYFYLRQKCSETN